MRESGSTDRRMLSHILYHFNGRQTHWCPADLDAHVLFLVVSLAMIKQLEANLYKSERAVTNRE